MYFLGKKAVSSYKIKSLYFPANINKVIGNYSLLDHQFINSDQITLEMHYHSNSSQVVMTAVHL